MRFILRVLSNTDQRAKSYIWKGALISLLPSVAIAGLVFAIVPEVKGPEFEGPVFLLAVGLLVFSPWVETLLMWPILGILGIFTRRRNVVALMSAVVWGFFHFLAAPVWGFLVLWQFFVYSTSFLEWSKKSRLKAITVTACIHMCQNLPGVVAIILTQ